MTLGPKKKILGSKKKILGPMTLGPKKKILGPGIFRAKKKDFRARGFRAEKKVFRARKMFCDLRGIFPFKLFYFLILEQSKREANVYEFTRISPKVRGRT
jgi:hypothetical protein